MMIWTSDEAPCADGGLVSGVWARARRRLRSLVVRRFRVFKRRGGDGDGTTARNQAAAQAAREAAQGTDSRGPQAQEKAVAQRPRMAISGQNLHHSSSGPIVEYLTSSICY